MSDNVPPTPEKAASAVKPEANRTMTSEAQDAMKENGVKNRSDDQRMVAALEAKGLLPALTLEEVTKPETRQQLATNAGGDASDAATVRAMATLSKFDQIDFNHDGTITPDETLSWQKAMQEKPTEVRYPDGRRLETQRNESRLYRPNGSSSSVDVQGDGTVVLTRDQNNQPTSVLNLDGSTLNYQNKNGQNRITSIDGINGAKVSIDYGPDGQPSTIIDRSVLLNPPILNKHGTAISIDPVTKTISYTDRNGNSAVRTTDGTTTTYQQFQDGRHPIQVKDPEGKTTSYSYDTNGVLTSFVRNGRKIAAPPNGTLSVDDVGSVRAMESDGRHQTLYKVDQSMVMSESKVSGGPLQVSEIRYRSGLSQQFEYNDSGVMTKYKDVYGHRYTSDDGVKWNDGTGRERHFQITSNSDGTTSAVLPDPRGGTMVDTATTDGRGSQQRLTYLDAPSSTILPRVTDGQNVASTVAPITDSQNGAPPVAQPIDANSAGAQSPNSDALAIQGTGSQRSQNADGSHTTTKNADGTRDELSTSVAGKTDYVMNSDGSINKITHTGSDGKVEILVPSKDGATCSVQIGDSAPFTAKLNSPDAATGAYSYDSQDGTISVKQLADGNRLESKKGPDGALHPTLVDRTDGVRYAITYGDDGSISDIKLHIDSKPDPAFGDNMPERNDTWTPTENAGEMRRSDGVVASGLKFNDKGDFSFVYVNEKGETVRHVDRADGTQDNLPPNAEF